jgi:hypothetical protein
VVTVYYWPARGDNIGHVAMMVTASCFPTWGSGRGAAVERRSANGNDSGE